MATDQKDQAYAQLAERVRRLTLQLVDVQARADVRLARLEELEHRVAVLERHSPGMRPAGAILSDYVADLHRRAA